MTIRRPEAATEEAADDTASPKRRRDRPSRYEFSTVTLTFRSGGDRCCGRLYRPDRPADPPLIVLGGGPIGAEGAGLDRFAERLAADGYAVFHFDARYTGASDGEPRNFLSPSSQRADWEAALSGLRGRSDVASDRLILWGIDLAGGTVLDVAADDPRVSAVIAQTPILDGRAFLRQRGIGVLLGSVVAGVRDRLTSRLLGTQTVSVVAEGTGKGGPALVSTPSAHRAYRDLAGDDWENRTPGRSLLALARYTADEGREQLSCPVLFIGGTRDDVVPIESVADASDALAEATLVRLPAGHFDLYDGTGFQQAVGHGRAFIDSVVSN